MCPPLKVSEQCPLVLLVMVDWAEGKALGSGLFHGYAAEQKKKAEYGFYCLREDYSY
jgi:hypothetical protein